MSSEVMHWSLGLALKSSNLSWLCRLAVRRGRIDPWVFDELLRCLPIRRAPLQHTSDQVHEALLILTLEVVLAVFKTLLRWYWNICDP